jgi:hypothetical protein
MFQHLGIPSFSGLDRVKLQLSEDMWLSQHHIIPFENEGMVFQAKPGKFSLLSL